jgi:hypothetical protein
MDLSNASRQIKENLMVQILSAGTPAPEFSLHVTPDQKLSLSELRGRPVILAFIKTLWAFSETVGASHHE